MPYYLHQWTYKDEQIRAMITKPQNRADVVRVATEAYGGKLHHFFFSFGEYDGVSISEFPDNVTAMACLMSIFGEGRLASIKTTALLTAEESQEAMRRALAMLGSNQESG
jgi:uncharacterized protein with GYD domain